MNDLDTKALLEDEEFNQNMSRRYLSAWMKSYQKEYNEEE